MRSSPKAQNGSTSHWWATRTAARPRCSTLFREATNTSAITAASRWTPSGGTITTKATASKSPTCRAPTHSPLIRPKSLYVRRHLAEHTPDVIINAVVASNLERNLYLTTELIDLNPRMVVALNMYDEPGSKRRQTRLRQFGTDDGSADGAGRRPSWTGHRSLAGHGDRRL